MPFITTWLVLHAIQKGFLNYCIFWFCWSMCENLMRALLLFCNCCSETSEKNGILPQSVAPGGQQSLYNKATPGGEPVSDGLQDQSLSESMLNRSHVLPTEEPPPPYSAPIPPPAGYSTGTIPPPAGFSSSQGMMTSSQGVSQGIPPQGYTPGIPSSQGYTPGIPPPSGYTPSPSVPPPAAYGNRHSLLNPGGGPQYPFYGANTNRYENLISKVKRKKKDFYFNFIMVVSQIACANFKYWFCFLRYKYWKSIYTLYWCDLLPPSVLLSYLPLLPHNPPSLLNPGGGAQYPFYGVNTIR